MNLNNLASQLRIAINEFLKHDDFSPQGNKLFKLKQKQLIGFSKEPQCLPVCIQILQSQTDQKITYFASMLLKDKLKYDFYQLDQNAILSTYQMLVNLIRKVSTPSKILLTNIMLALTYLYIHSIDKAGTVMEFFAMAFNSNGQQNSLDNKVQFLYFFKFLELLPQQVNDPKLVIDQQSKNKAQLLLQSQQTQVLKQMHLIYNKFNVSSDSPQKLSFNEQEILLNAFSAWIQLNVANEQITNSIHHHSLMNLAVQSMNNDLIFEAADRCIKMALEIMVLPENNKDLFMFLSDKLLGSIPKFDKILRQCQYQIVQQYVKVLCEYGSVSGSFLISNYNQSVQNYLVHMISYLQTAQLDVFEEMVDFWQSFISCLKQSQNSGLSKQIVYQIIQRLLVVLFNRTKYQLSDLEVLNQISERQFAHLHQRGDDIQDRRDKGGYIFYAISQYIGKQGYVQLVLSMIHNLDQNNQSEFITLFESMISSLVNVVDKYPNLTESICKIVLLYEQIDTSYIMMKRSYCRMFDQLFSILNKNQEFIMKILEYVVKMLEIPLLSSRAEKTFDKCCRQNATVVAKHIQQLYNLINVYPDRTGLLSGISYVMKQSPQLILSVIPNLFNIQNKRINEILSNSKLSKSTKKNALLSTFENIFALYKCVPSKNLSESQIEMLQTFLLAIMPSILSIIRNPFKKQTDEDKVVQQSIKFLKITLRLIPDQFLAYLQHISAQIIESYKKNPLSSFVYFYQLVLTEYRYTKQNELSSFLLSFFVQICNITFKHIQEFGGIGSLAILADDFLGLSKRVITYNKLDLLLQSQQVENIFKFAIMGLNSSQSRVASTASQFFETVFMIYWTPYSRKQYEVQNIGEVVEYNPNNIQLYNQLKQYILPTVPKLIRDLFKALEKVPFESAESNILDCLSAIALAFPSESEQLWTNPLNQIQVDILTNIEKANFKKHLLGLGSNDHGQFNNHEMKFDSLLNTASKRYLNRYRRERLTGMK